MKPLEDSEDIKALLKRVRRVEIVAQRLVNEELSGRYHSVFKGRGMSFEEVRPYSPGDEVRLIDWNVSARTGEVYVKQFVEERELTVVIVADASSSMDFGLCETRYQKLKRVEVFENTKRQLSAEIAAAIALSAQMNNDRVGLVTFGSDVERFVPPKKGRLHCLRVIREVLAMKAKGSASDLGKALSFLGRVLKRKSAIFIVSDFEVLDFEKPLRVLSRRHDIHAFIVRDPFEDRLPLGGIVALKDAETGEIVFVRATKALVQRLQENAMRHLSEVETVLNRLRVPFTYFYTDRPYEISLTRHFARLKGKAM
jgi:uncharacterized protein (DUF58 family)